MNGSADILGHGIGGQYDDDNNNEKNTCNMYTNIIPNISKKIISINNTIGCILINNYVT